VEHKMKQMDCDLKYKVYNNENYFIKLRIMT